MKKRFVWESHTTSLSARGGALLGLGVALSLFTMATAGLWFVVTYWLTVVVVGQRFQIRPAFEVGTDGVLVRDRFRTSFTPHAAIRDIRRFLYEKFGALMATEILRIEELARKTESNEALVETLLQSGTFEASTYRDPALPIDDLWTVLEDGRAPPRARIVAARLLHATGEVAAERIGEVVEVTADPALRQAFVRASHGAITTA